MKSNFYKQHQREGLLASSTTGWKFVDNLEMSNRRAAHNFAFIPPFAFQDEQLKAVLRHRAWRYVHSNTPIPASWDYAAINLAATKKALRGHEIVGPDQQHALQDKHIAAVKRAGSYMALQSSIAWRSWRLGMPSTEVAFSLCVSPWMVRQALRRLRAIAAGLGYECGRRHHSFGDDNYNRRDSEQAVEVQQ